MTAQSDIDAIEKAQHQIMSAEKHLRKGMLAKLPAHIRDMVEERMRAMWVEGDWGAVMFASDNSEDGYHDACVYLEQMGIPDTAVRRLPKNNALWVVAKKSLYISDKGV